MSAFTHIFCRVADISRCGDSGLLHYGPQLESTPPFRSLPVKLQDT